jgi:hypothetical protein
MNTNMNIFQVTQPQCNEYFEIFVLFNKFTLIFIAFKVTAIFMPPIVPEGVGIESLAGLDNILIEQIPSTDGILRILINNL